MLCDIAGSFADSSTRDASVYNSSRPLSNGSEQADPIDQLNPHHDILLCEWDAALTRLLSNAKPYRLQLHLLCDCSAYATALCVLEPLRPTRSLGDFSIRLSRKADEDLKRLAAMTVLQAVGKDPITECAFRFLDLPRELRTKVLGYTDLVTPLSEVEWSPKLGYSVSYFEHRCRGPLDCPERFHHACQFRGCWRRDGNTGCFCNRYHAAFDFRCNCWRPPQPLFLACQSMRDDAESVFFSKNRFTIKPVDGRDISPPPTPYCLEAALFLSQAVRPSALCHLRYLEIVFPTFGDRYCLESGTALSHWRDTLDLVREKLCHPMFTLHIYMPNHNKCGCGVRTHQRELSKEQGIDMLKTYLRILQPFSAWLDVKRLYLDLAWPWCWTAFDYDRSGFVADFVEGKDRWTTDQIGRAVLGKDYERLRQGKDDLIPAQWREIEFAYSKLREKGDNLDDYDCPHFDSSMLDARSKELLEDESLTLTRLFQEG